MKISNLNEWLSLAANVGVLVGIIFLAVEMQQNTQMTRAQTRDAMTEKQMAFYELMISEPDTLELGSKYRNPTEADRGTAEFGRFAYLTLTQLRMWENEYYQYRQGLFEPQEFEGRLDLWVGTIMGNPGRREVWDRQKYSFGRDFVEMLDGMLNQFDAL